MSQTLSAPQALQLLRALGLSIDNFSEEDTPDFNEETLLQTIDEHRIKAQEPQLLQRAKKELEGGFKGRMLGTVRSAAARKLGLSKDALEAFDTVEDILHEAVKSHAAQYEQATASIRTEAQAQLQQQQEAFAVQTADFEAQIQAATTRYQERDIDMALLEAVNKVPRTGGDPMKQAALLKTHLRTDYHLLWDEGEKKLSLRDKTHPEKPVYGTDATRELAPEDVFPAFFDGLGLLAKDNRHIKPTEAMNQFFPGTPSVLHIPAKDTPAPQYEMELSGALERLASGE